MLRPASWMEMGVPAASGATWRTALEKRASTALLLESPLGKTDTLASPPASTQSLTRSGGSEARVTGWACSRPRSWSNKMVSGATRVSEARARTAGGAATSFCSTSAR